MKSQTTRTGRRLAVPLLVVLALVAAACVGEGDDAAEGDGGTVDVLTAFTEPDDVRGFEAMLAAFEEATGHRANHEGSPDFETQAVTLVEGGNPPDIMMHPQPGLLLDFIDQGAVQPLDVVSEEARDNLVEGLVEVGTFDDTFYGLQVRLSLKSLVWYPQPAFDDAGYTVPETYDELIALSQQIVDDGGTPWCIGIESSGATGWVATDWMEDLMLRLHGPEVYDDWVTNDLAFDSPEVVEAGEAMADIWFADDFVLGGRANILQTDFGSSPLPMFEDPPGCFLHRQASFIQQTFEEADATFGEDFDFFLFPPTDPDEVGNPVLIAGDLAALYTDNEAARDLIEFMATAEAQEAWAAEGGFICSVSDCDPGVYPNDAFVQQAELINEAEFARFDGSDLMPGAVGAGAFWTEMVRWINEETDLEGALSAIEDSWPE